MIEEVTVFRTADGRTFEDHAEAAAHAADLAIDARVGAYLARMEATPNAKARAGTAIRRFLKWEADACQEG